MRKQTLEERLELYVADKVSKDTSPHALLLAASAVAGVSAILVPPPAEAAIVYSGAQNEAVSEAGGLKTVDFNGDGAECTFSVYATSETYTQQLVVKLQNTKVIKYNNNPKNLSENYTVSSQKNFSTISYDNLAANNTSASGNFLNKQGFLGVEFEIGSNTHYGWIQYKANSDASVGTIIDWAYEDTPDKAIKAGDTGSAADDFDWNLFLPAILAGAKK